MKTQTKTQHTPGPWNVERSSPGDTSNCAKAGCRAAVRGQVGPDICWVKVYDDEVSRNWEANARLIAAAPDLLAALETILNQRADGAKVSREEWQAATEAARAALAKAKP